MRWPDHRLYQAHRWRPAIAAGLCLSPSIAEAHTTFQGIGSFWSGAAHLLTSLDQLGFLLGLAIWASFQNERLDARVIAAGFAAAFAGICLGASWGITTRLDPAALPPVLMAAVGLAGAARLRAGNLPVLGAAVIGGLVLGVASAEAATGFSVALFSLGSAVAAASVLSYGLLAARRLDPDWGQIARRAGASWIAAIGLMVFALSVVSRPGPH